MTKNNSYTPSDEFWCSWWLGIYVVGLMSLPVFCIFPTCALEKVGIAMVLISITGLQAWRSTR